MSQPNTSQVIELLTRVYEKPTLYMRTLNGIDEFLDGVRTASLFFGGPVRDVEIYQEILQERGWDPYLGVSREELQKNKAGNQKFPTGRLRTFENDLEIAQELLNIEIETWKRMSHAM